MKLHLLIVHLRYPPPLRKLNGTLTNIFIKSIKIKIKIGTYLKTQHIKQNKTQNIREYNHFHLNSRKKYRTLENNRKPKIYNNNV